MNIGREAWRDGRFIQVLALATVFGCEPKVYPAAEQEVMATLNVDTEPSGTVELTADAGGMAGSPGASFTEPGGNSGGSDTSELRPVADAGCTPVSLFPDRDGDGYGSDDPEDVIQACPPVDGYVTDNTDCHDADHTGRDPARDVFPGQSAFFTVGYPTAKGISFDYDCSGHEEADPDNQFVPAPTNCEERMPPLCGSDLGYVLPVDPRSGEGVNPLCGERRLGLCNPTGVVCGLNVLTAGDPFPCR